MLCVLVVQLIGNGKETEVMALAMVAYMDLLKDLTRQWGAARARQVKDNNTEPSTSSSSGSGGSSSGGSTTNLSHQQPMFQCIQIAEMCFL